MALSRPWAQFKVGSVTWWINRAFDHPDLRAHLAAPEHLMDPPAQRLTRDSSPRSTELVRAEWQGLVLYIKRYRQRNVAQTLKDILRPSRARRAFQCAFALREQGVNTPLPMAAGEVRVSRWLKDSF